LEIYYPSKIAARARARACQTICGNSVLSRERKYKKRKKRIGREREKDKKANSTLNGQFEKYKCSVIRSIRHEIEMLLERSVIRLHRIPEIQLVEYENIPRWASEGARASSRA